MPMSLNRAAEQRAALNWVGTIGPLGCSALVVAIIAARVLGQWTPLERQLGDIPATTALLRALLACQLPLVWIFIETTPWRRYAAMRRGRRVLAWQALALLAALAAMILART